MIRILVIAFVLAICDSTFLRADFVLEFSDAAGQAKNSFAIASVGGTVDVSIYLVETAPSTLLFEEGLFSAAFRLDYSTGGGSSVATVANTSKVSFDPIFDFTDPAVTLGENSVSLDLATTDLGFGIGMSQIRLATIQFSGVNQGTLQLKLSALSFDNFLTNTNLTSFDNSINFSNTASLSVSAVPEPSSMLLVLGPSIGFFIGFRRRRNCRYRQISISPVSGTSTLLNSPCDA